MTIEELERLRLKQRCFYTKEETKELLKNISLKVEVEELPDTGIENYMYLVPALIEGHYNQFIWNDNQWLSLGESKEDFTNYVTEPELEKKLDKITFITDLSDNPIELLTNCYYDLGTRDTLVITLPTKTEMVDGYEIQISGYSSDLDGFMLSFTIYDNDPYDIQTVINLLTAQENSGGVSGTYDLTTKAEMSFQTACTERDKVGDSVPNIDSSTSKLVECEVRDYTRAVEFLFTFIYNSDNCSLTLPTNVKYGSNLDFDNDKQEGRRFQFSIQDNIALYTYVDLL